MTTTERVPLLTSDVARLLGVVPATVRLWERSGRLKAARTERGVRLFSRDEVERFALAREAEARKLSTAAVA